ncbi:MAG: hypothetical protein ABIL68_15935 [bacterium]
MSDVACLPQAGIADCGRGDIGWRKKSISNVGLRGRKYRMSDCACLPQAGISDCGLKIESV